MFLGCGGISTAKTDSDKQKTPCRGQEVSTAAIFGCCRYVRRSRVIDDVIVKILHPTE